MRLVYNVYDDENQIESKQFDNFPEALEYAKQGLITYICEEDLDCPECEERVVWTWDSTWDDEEAISNVKCEKQNTEPCVEDSNDNIEITISGPAEEVESLIDLIFDDAFDLDWDSPVEETKVEEQDFADEFGYEDEPATIELDFDIENPFENDLYNLERDLGEDDLEIGEPEIVVDPAEEFKEDQPKKLVEEAEEELEELVDEEIEDEPTEILTTVEEIKEIAAEAGEAIASVYEDKPMLEQEDIKEITDEVVENKLEEQSEDEPEELDEELYQKKKIPTYTLKELEDEVERDSLTIDTEEERSETIGLSGTEIRISGSSDSGYHIYEVLYDTDGEEYEGADLEDFDNIVELASYLDDAGYIKVTDLDQYLEEGYKIDLPQTTVKKIKDELDQYGNMYFDLFTPIEERSGDNYRRATRVKLVKAESNYEIYLEWMDQFDDLLIVEPELVLSTFEEVLREIDDKYVNIIDLNESKKMTKDELLDKEGTTDVDLINAGRPEEERVELAESISQEISRAYKQLSKEYGRDIEELVYGPNGFMATNYPNGLPDFRGDIIYSDKYWAEFEEWLEAQDQIEEDLEDDLTDQEFAEQLQARLQEADVKSTAIDRPEAPKDLSVVKEPGDPSISEGDLVWFNTRKGEDVVVKIIKFTKDPEGNRNGCRVVYTEPRVTRPHKDTYTSQYFGNK